MKNKLALIIALVFAMSTTSFAQFTFGVSPGFGLNGTYFGYSINKNIVPYFGFQYMNANFMYEESGLEYDFQANQIIPYKYDEEFKGSIFIPSIGARYFFNTENKIRPYANLSLSKPFLKGEYKVDGETQPEVEDAVDAVKLWGLTAGYGVEYFFDDHFSIGGEFGFMYFHVKYEDTYDTDVYDPNSGNYIPSEVDQKMTLSSNPTYSRISLNFYF